MMDMTEFCSFNIKNPKKNCYEKKVRIEMYTDTSNISFNPATVALLKIISIIMVFDTS